MISHLCGGALDHPHSLAREIWDRFRRTEADFQDFLRQAASRPPLELPAYTRQGGGKRHHLGEFGGMFFTRMGFVFAHLFFWYGLFGVAFAIYQGLNHPDFADNQGAATAYLISEVGEGLTRAVFGLALGVLCEISSKKHKADQQA
ncbi:hypothetical protein [Pseudotabrizicola alkalilacus]|uniref:Uncharacterized protein n=1 Tax=Pseudotabrizicola alkalilacus TaxID=2305252 RepID=A0A411Z1C0_9RHOB|nr:hypothetical protein [Pseudotabrizicola alkalilacus]RGP36871.1 hypothetical protein D1012_11980 [Pseudotabrizicola alkalilacus]